MVQQYFVLNIVLFWRAQRVPAEKTSENGLSTVRGRPKGLRDDIGSLKRFCGNRHLAC
jgi:hypothetical protein